MDQSISEPSALILQSVVPSHKQLTSWSPHGAIWRVTNCDDDDGPLVPSCVSDLASTYPWLYQLNPLPAIDHDIPVIAHTTLITRSTNLPQTPHPPSPIELPLYTICSAMLPSLLSFLHSHTSKIPAIAK